MANVIKLDCCRDARPNRDYLNCWQLWATYTLCISPAESIGWLSMLTMQQLHPEVFGFCRGIYWIEGKMPALGKGFDNTLQDLTPAGEWILHFPLLCSGLVEWLHLKATAVPLWAVAGAHVLFRVPKNILEKPGDHIRNTKVELLYQRQTQHGNLLRVQ